jgi:Tfp pilus assembly pilus retraction ATPase PilT
LNWGAGREAIDLAARGHLVLGMVYGSQATSPLSGVLYCGASTGEIRAHFLGGWTQTLVRQATGRGQIGLFNCMSRAEALNEVLNKELLNNSARDAEQIRGLWHDAEEKIAQGLITREDAAERIFPLDPNER